VSESSQNIVEEHHSVSLLLPVTLDELERFCQRLRAHGCGGEKVVRPIPVDGHTVRLSAELMARQ
jgi:hypothetical protein